MVFDAEHDVKSELSGQPQFERDATKQFVERLFSGYAV